MDRKRKEETWPKRGMEEERRKKRRALTAQQRQARSPGPWASSAPNIGLVRGQCLQDQGLDMPVRSKEGKEVWCMRNSSHFFSSGQMWAHIISIYSLGADKDHDPGKENTQLNSNLGTGLGVGGQPVCIGHDLGHACIPIRKYINRERGGEEQGYHKDECHKINGVRTSCEERFVRDYGPGASCLYRSIPDKYMHVHMCVEVNRVR